MEAPLPDRADGRRHGHPRRSRDTGRPEGRALSGRRAVGAGLAVAACLLPPAAGVAAGLRPFDFESFFEGRLTGSGTVDNRREGTHRPFTATIAAHWNGPHGTIDEDLAYADGETRRFAWAFDRIGPGRYIGHRDDLVGQADVSLADDGTLRMVYAARTRLPSGQVWTLAFDDRFEQSASGAVTVTGAVSYLFIGVGATHMTIVKTPR